MTRTMLAAISIAAGMASAQTSLTSPQVGFMHDAADSVRPVYGLAGNFLVGDALAGGVVSAAFSGSYALLKTGTAVIVMGRSGGIVSISDAPDGPAQFAFTRNGDPALTYLQKTSALLIWKAGAFEAATFDLAAWGAGAVLCIGMPDAEHAALLVQRDGDLWDVRISIATGEMDSQTALLGVVPPVQMLPTGDLVFANADGIVVRKADGSERSIEAPALSNFALEQMGDGWIQVHELVDGRQFALRLTETGAKIYQLPEVSQ